jgi:hypothetical protein
MSMLTDAMEFVRDPTGEMRRLDQEAHSGPPEPKEDDLQRLTRACIMTGTTGFEDAILQD